MSTPLQLKKSIFLADDDKVWTDSIRGLLALRGFERTGSCNVAAQAIREAAAFKPNILLVDLRWDTSIGGDAQPDQGDDILRRIEDIPEFKSIYIAVLTKELKPEHAADFNGKWRGYDLIIKTSSPTFVDDLIAFLRSRGVL